MLVEQDLGTAAVPVPSITRGSYGDLPWAGSGTAPIPVGRWAIVRVTGSLTLQPNSPYYDPLCYGSSSCYARSGELVRPTTDGLNVGIALGATAEPTTQSVSQRYLYVPSSGDQNVGEYFLYNSSTSDYYIWRTRPGPPGGQLCGNATCYPGSTGTGQSWTEQYRFSGAQSISVMLVTPITVVSTATSVSTTNRGDSIDYTMVVNHGLRRMSSGRVSSISWQYVRRDTLATTNNNSTGFSSVEVYACMNQTTCRYRDTIPGRMLVQTTLENTWASGKSEVVRPVSNKLSVTCTTPVKRGQRSSCTASVSPATSFTVAEWTYAGTSANVQLDTVADLKQWEILPPVSGTVSVRAVVGGVEQMVSTQITVTDCDFFRDPQPDPRLNDPVFQAGMIDIAHKTGWNLPLRDRLEHAGYLVQTPGGGEQWVEAEYVSQNLCISERDSTQRSALTAGGNQILADAHTHPTGGGNFPNPGNCLRINKAKLAVETNMDTVIHFNSGPSWEDLFLWQHYQNANPPVQYPGFALEPDELHMWEIGPDGKLHQRHLRLNRGANACLL